MRVSPYIFLLVLSSVAEAQSYTYSSFDVIGSTQTIVNGMNNSGQIVGSYTDAQGNTHNFVRSADGTSYATIDLPGATPGTTTTDAINNLAQLAGNYMDAVSGLYHSYIRSADGNAFTSFDIPNFGPRFGPRGINDNGDVAGVQVQASASVGIGFLRTADGAYTPITIRGGGIVVLALDNNRDIVGWYKAGGSAEGLIHGFIRSPAGVITAMDLPGTDNFTQFTSINNHGQLAGTWAGGTSFASISDGSFPIIAFPGAPFTVATAINDNGSVAGYYYDSSGNRHGFIAVPSSGSPQPVIRSFPPGVITALAFGGESTVATGTWIEIYGDKLASTTRAWRASDFTGNAAPTSLDGVTVHINGGPAYVSYISPGQVNALVPSTIGAGTAQITVTNGAQTSAAYSVTVKAVQPALLVLPRTDNQNNQYVAAVFPDFVTYVLPPGYTTAVPTRRAHPGDTIVLFGMGLGAVRPDVPGGQIATQVSTMQTLPQVFIGGVPATVTYAGLVAGTVALYQINVVVPNLTMPAGQTFNDAVNVHLVVNGVEVPASVPGGVPMFPDERNYMLPVAQQ